MKKKTIFIIIGIIALIGIIAAVIFLVFKPKGQIKDSFTINELFPIYYDSTIQEEYTGFLYKKNYTVDTLTNKEITVLFIDYYLANYDVFNQENTEDQNHYQKQISTKEAENVLTKMFGPNHKPMVLEDITYGCNKSLKKVNDGYIIGADDIEFCGLYDEDREQYISFISNQEKTDDSIIITLRVGYVVPLVIEDEYYELSAYTDETKSEFIANNYSYDCLGGNDPSCYASFPEYKLVMKKAKDKNYYFYSISKV